MKKKIRDLTKEEIEKLCDNYFEKHKNCQSCPLNGINNCLKYLGLNLDQEIEVEDRSE